MRPKLLDLFCKAGGAGMGYYLAGFEVIGVDKDPQPRYPFKFFQSDAIDFMLNNYDQYDAIHASPPCQIFSTNTNIELKSNHQNYIPTLQYEFKRLKIKNYVIENVSGARHSLRSPIMLCGTMFGLNIQRHRYFETSIKTVMMISPCQHTREPVVVSGSSYRAKHDKRYEYNKQECAEAMQIDWMIRTELD